MGDQWRCQYVTRRGRCRAPAETVDLDGLGDHVCGAHARLLRRRRTQAHGDLSMLSPALRAKIVAAKDGG